MTRRYITIALGCLAFCVAGAFAQAAGPRKPAPQAATAADGAGAFATGNYRNLFSSLLGVTQAESDGRIGQVWNHFFENEGTKVYFEDTDTTAYILDTGNNDVRTEGMSYGMMICVQLDRRVEFDRLWRWARANMRYRSGRWKGYFAWQCNPDGTKIGGEPSCASDGEAYFITALFFAAHRWGNGGAFDYEADAQQILKDIMSKDGSQGIYNMFNTDSRLISFVPSYGSWLHTDPSYNLPAFLELWAMWTDTNKDFWAQTPGAARQLLADASHPVTGLFPDYSTFDGKPFQPEWKHDYDARRYQYDAMRCAMNVGMDCHWFGKDSLRQRAMMTRLLTFFKNDNFAHGHFNWDGSDPSGTYTAGMVGANAVGAFCLDDKALAAEYVRRLWDTKPPTGRFRYYDGMVYMLSMLHVAGRFRIY